MRRELKIFAGNREFCLFAYYYNQTHTNFIETYSMSCKKLIAAAVIAGCFFSSCGTPEGSDEDFLETPDTIKTSVLNVGGELFSVPSPIQTALMVQKSGLPYDQSMLNPVNQVNTYNTDDARAFILGVYGADLAYVSLYNQTQDALKYLASIKQLTDKLGLTSAFDSGTMQRIRDNITNKDSMMTLVGIAYRASDAYLKDNRRSDIGGLILTGGWIESMHFSMTSYKRNPSEAIRRRIAEQKQALTSIRRILDNNESQEVKEVSRMLNELSQVYDKVGFTYVYEEPRTDTVKKITYINSRTEITISEEQINDIAAKIQAIRTNILNNSKLNKEQ